MTEAWSPLAQGAVLDDPAIVAIAERHERTPGQVVLRWHLQLGNVVIPKSVTPERIGENFDVFDFELTDGRWRRSRRSTAASGSARIRTRSSGPRRLQPPTRLPGSRRTLTQRSGA